MIRNFIETDEKDEDGNPKLVMNPKYIEFMTEYNAVLEQSKEIDVPVIQLDELKYVETSDNYALIFRYLIQKPNEELVEPLVEVVE